ncbi:MULTISPECIES: alpha/beta fold hydrolase [Solibacillus]|uniref:Alpha/beta hydrolase n=1 Tax=Solibacillus merdavium TaxID=2762218 RepID=A0ABR8XM76_9BACL|nr:alpha/beta hydrolase [Solibacillus merdavium]MBD8033011.1 alpha/beta hydrolase [Solibacillus merdavium]
MTSIFVHGLGQNSSSWEETITFMGESNQMYHPDLFDLVKGQELTYKNLYAAFSEYIEKLLEPVNLVGLSLGAILALNYTIDHPEKVQSLVLIAPQYKMPKLLLKVQNIVFRFIPKSSFQKLGSSKSDFIRLTESMTDLDFSQGLKRIGCNTLVVCGEKDKANKRAAEQLAAQLPNADISIVKGAGHEVNTDAPEKLASLLTIFLKETVKG